MGCYFLAKHILFMLCFNIPVFSSPRASVMSIIVKGLAGYCLTIACLYILLIVLSLPQHLKSQYVFIHISSKPLCGTGIMILHGTAVKRLVGVYLWPAP